METQILTISLHNVRAPPIDRYTPERQQLPTMTQDRLGHHAMKNIAIWSRITTKETTSVLLLILIMQREDSTQKECPSSIGSEAEELTEGLPTLMLTTENPTFLFQPFHPRPPLSGIPALIQPQMMPFDKPPPYPRPPPHPTPPSKPLPPMTTKVAPVAKPNASNSTASASPPASFAFPERANAPNAKTPPKKRGRRRAVPSLGREGRFWTGIRRRSRTSS